ncbi:MAG: saccharopine dehydrogenase [Chlorobi bacterium]|nr:saccharopine dehydrogenase [Chlorobiota bacterium]
MQNHKINQKAKPVSRGVASSKSDVKTKRSDGIRKEASVLVIGAGMSAARLINYLEQHSEKYNWKLTVADKHTASIKKIVRPETKVVRFDIFDDKKREKLIKEVDVVVSLLPARFHIEVARTCLKFEKSLFTASYESDEMRELADEIEQKGLLFLNETGLDPGIDHMSAMNIIDRIKAEGHKLLDFESFTGGLIAPDSDDNPWHYKFTWNPRNVVVAGQGEPAKFIQEGKYKYIPYNRLFRRTELIEIEGYGRFEGYANRDSLKYIKQYQLEGVPTVYRGTLRRPGFCRAWNVFVQLGMTDDTYYMENTENMTYREFVNSFLYYHPSDSVRTKLFHYMHIDQDSDIIEKLDWLELFSNKKLGLKKATPAQALQHILAKKWKLKPDDRDMIVMWHKFIYREKGKRSRKELTSSLVVEGKSRTDTAMSQTVGLPLAMAVKLYLTGKLKVTGLRIPNFKEIYEPILEELKEYGIEFKENLKDKLNGS